MVSRYGRSAVDCDLKQHILTQTGRWVYFGQLIDVLLANIVNSIVALPDITESESERLARVTRMLHPLQELFTTSEGKVSTDFPTFCPCS